ncbi:MAG: TIGR04211 family SH3 domain-containing protein [Gammaproteobacteria bacterium]|nr:TIGR04211 family SH3 domain-containing protein [Gammaproteobacteria bacterium]
MKKSCLPILLACLALAPVITSAAETAYVTDRLLLGVYDNPQGRGKPARTLESGTPVTRLERSGSYEKVRAPDGSEGWVKRAYLVDEQPARAALPALEAKHERLQKQAAELREHVDTLEAELARSAQARSELERVRRENASLKSALAGPGVRVHAGILAGGAALLLLVGLIAGAYWMDYRNRRRHGGFRI